MTETIFMDLIKIKGLEVFAYHGVYREEQQLGQKFVVNAELMVDTRKAGCSDSLLESVNYAEVCHFITAFMKEHTYQLIEAAAEKLAAGLLTNFSLLRGVRLEVEKPCAPIGLPVRTVSVEITRVWHRAYIALGSNLGDVKGYLDGAVKALSETEGCRVVRVSDYITTKPYGVTDQPDFLNGVLMLQTLLEPEELLELLHDIENKAERKRETHWGPRTLDLDILLYDELVLDSPTLVIPHKEMHLREFVLRPLAQIAPYLRHPVSGQTVEEMLHSLMQGASSSSLSEFGRNGDVDNEQGGKK